MPSSFGSAFRLQSTSNALFVVRVNPEGPQSAIRNFQSEHSVPSVSSVVKSSLHTSPTHRLVDAEFLRQRFPLGINQQLRLRVHRDLVRPGAREAFSGPLSGRVDAHLGAVVGEPGSVVERVDGAERELDVAFRIDVVEDLQRDLADVLHVHIFVDDEDALGEHGLSQRPDGVHDFAGLAGIGLADGNDHQVMEYALEWKVYIDELGNGELHERKENALDGLAHPAVFHRRLAHDGGGVDGFLAMRNAGDVEDGVEIVQRIKTGVVAEGPLGAEFVKVDVALQNDFSIGWDFEVDGLALDELDGLLPEEAGNQEFFDVRWGGNNGAEGERGIGANGDGDFHFARGHGLVGELGASRGAGHDVDRGGVANSPSFACLHSRVRLSLRGPCCCSQSLAVVFGGDFLALPMHAGGAGIEDLHAVHADVALPGSGVARDDAWQRDKTARILGPALQDRKIEKREAIATDDFLAGSGLDGLREELAHLGEHGEHFDFVEKALRGFNVHEGADAVGDFVERVDVEGETHATLGAELVDE